MSVEYRRTNPIGRRRRDWLKDRAIWLLVLGSLFQGGAAAVLVWQLRVEDENRKLERAMWKDQLEATQRQMTSVLAVLQATAGDQAQPSPQPPPPPKPVTRKR
jgi:hypothetical protein